MEKSNKTSSSKNFSGLVELMEKYKDDRLCTKYLVQKRWNGKIICPRCKDERVYKFKDGKRYKCGGCRDQFTARTGTIFEGSKISLRKWLIAIYMVTSHKKGISSYQLAQDLKVTQKTAWFMLHRIRFALNSGSFDVPLGEHSGIVEIDETFVGGKNKNRHKDKKVPKSQGRSFKDKTPVLGLVERGGNVKAFVVSNTSTIDLLPIVEKNVYPDIVIMSDEWWKHSKLYRNFDHAWINHRAKQYVDGEVHTNTIEGFWSHLKRSIFGIYHQVTRKHLQQYVDEAVFRYNTRLQTDEQRTGLFLTNSCVRLKYKVLIQKI